MQEISVINNVEDITQAIIKLSEKCNIPVNKINISLLSYRTLYGKDNDEISLRALSNELLDDDDFFEDSRNFFRQLFNISVSKLTKPLNFSLKVNGNFQSVEIIFNNDFIIPKNDAEFEIFFSFLLAQMAKEKIILRKINYKKMQLKSYFKNFLSKSIILDTSKVYKDIKQAYLDFNTLDILINNKNYISLKANTLIAEFYFKQDGVNGRNLSGEYIIYELDSNKTPPSITDDIREVKDDKSIKYYSINSGFVIFEKNSFTFTKEVQLTNVSFSDKYNFIGSIESESKITINTIDEFNDALGEGINIIANIVIINGSIGARTKINASKVKVVGQTHRTSFINAIDSDINIHKGYLKSINTKIFYLDNGVLDSTKADIIKVNGGNIEVNEIHIKQLFSSSNIRFSVNCVIDDLVGGENRIIFATLTNKNKEEFLSINKHLEQLKLKEKALNKKLQTLINKYNKFKPTATYLKNIINSADSNVDDYITNSYKEFIELSNLIKTLTARLNDLYKEIDNLNTKLNNKHFDLSSSSLICLNGWKKFNYLNVDLGDTKSNIIKHIVNGAGKYYIVNNDIVFVPNKKQDNNL